jgi:hypothetical protein
MGVIVLNEHRRDSFFNIFGLMIGFQEKTAVVIKNNRLNENDFGKGRTFTL